MNEVIYISRFGGDIKTITDYINAEGLYPSTAKAVSDLYSMFSEECYSAGWMTPSEKVLVNFTAWLKEFCTNFNLYSEEI